jgi:hypothetical protein
MSRYAPVTVFAFLPMLWYGTSASAETLRCQSVNGNLNCAGSGAVSCQTVDGKKVCTSGRGDVVQSFGKGTSSSSSSRDSGDGDDDEDLNDTSPHPGTHQHVDQHGPGGKTLQVDRDGTKLHVRTDKLSIDRE